MPYYDYECPKCGAFEIEQRMSDPALTHHECGEAVTRTISKVGFMLKGGGWSADGYTARSSATGEGTCNPAGCANMGCPAKLGA